MFGFWFGVAVFCKGLVAVCGLFVWWSCLGFGSVLFAFVVLWFGCRLVVCVVFVCFGLGWCFRLCVWLGGLLFCFGVGSVCFGCFCCLYAYLIWIYVVCGCLVFVVFGGLVFGVNFVLGVFDWVFCGGCLLCLWWVGLFVVWLLFVVVFGFVLISLFVLCVFVLGGCWLWLWVCGRGLGLVVAGWIGFV